MDPTDIPQPGPSAAEAPASEPSPTATPDAGAPSQAAPPTVDWQGYSKQLEERLSGWEGSHRQFMEDVKKQMQERDDRMLQVFAPELYKQKQAPQYVTREDFDRGMEMAGRRAAREVHEAQYLGQLEAAKEKHPRVFEFYDSGEADAYFRQLYVKTGNVVKAAADLDAKIGKQLAAASQRLAQEKKVSQETIKGDGSPGRPSMKATGTDSGRRGIARLRALRNQED